MIDPEWYIFFAVFTTAILFFVIGVILGWKLAKVVYDPDL